MEGKDNSFTFAKKRESGEKPERTGHCKQGMSLLEPLRRIEMCEKEKVRDDL